MCVAASVEKCSVFLPLLQIPPSPFFSCRLHLFFSVLFLLSHISSFIFLISCCCSVLVINLIYCAFFSFFLILSHFEKNKKGTFKVRNFALTKTHKRPEIHITNISQASALALHHGFPAISFLNPPAVAPSVVVFCTSKNMYWADCFKPYLRELRVVDSAIMLICRQLKVTLDFCMSQLIIRLTWC